MLRDGAVVQCGTPSELWEAPADAWTARFLGGAAVLAATACTAAAPAGAAAGAASAATVLGVLPMTGPPPARGPLSVVVRPDQVRLVAPTEAVAAGVLTSVRFLGHGVLAQVRLVSGTRGGGAAGTVLTCRVPAGQAAGLRVGERCGVVVRGPVHPLTSPP